VTSAGYVSCGSHYPLSTLLFRYMGICRRVKRVVGRDMEGLLLPGQAIYSLSNLYPCSFLPVLQNEL